MIWMRLSKQMKRILLLLLKEKGGLELYEILEFLEGEQGFTPSKRISYHRSLKRLIGLGLIKMMWVIADVVPNHTVILRTRRFKLFQLTDKGMKEAKKIRERVSEIIREFQSLL